MKLYNYLENIEILETNITRFDSEITGVTSRSYDVKTGYIFVCIRGLNEDGHSFSVTAEKLGASLLVVDNVNEAVIASGLPYIKVKNTRAVLALMCAKSYGNPEKMLRIIGVTGTNGKTSTCRLLSEIYRRAGSNVETIGTLGGGLTTPDPEDLFKAFRKAFDSGVDTVVMEVSSHALFFDKLCGVNFENAIFTNLTPEHLDLHGNMDDYAEAKAKLFASSRCGMYNIDDPSWKKIASCAGGKVYTYSFSERSADYYVCNYVSHGVNGFEYDLMTPRSSIYLRSELCGTFNVYNTLSAAACAHADRIDGEVIANAVASVANVPGRLEKVDLGNVPFELFIDYAHSPDALENVLECIRSFKRQDQKITLLFGCGGDRDRSKRRVMGKIASRLADFVIVTSDNCRSENAADIISEIMKGIDKERPHIVIEDRRRAIEYAIANGKENDIILFAGKGHEKYEIGKNGKTYFDEKQIAADAVFKRFKEK